MEEQKQQTNQKKDGSFSKEKALEAIDKYGKLIPPEIKDMLVQNLDLPERIVALEESLQELAHDLNSDLIADKMMARFQKAAEERRQRAEERASQGNQPGKGPGGFGVDKGQVGQVLQAVIYKAIMGGGESTMDQYLKRMGTYNLIEGMTFDRMIRRQILRNMGGTVYNDFKKAIDALKIPEAGEGSSESAV